MVCSTYFVCASSLTVFPPPPKTSLLTLAVAVGTLVVLIGMERLLPHSPAPLVAVAGGIAAAGVLYVIASGKAGFDLSGGFASNGFGEHSPGGYSLLACFVAEVVPLLAAGRIEPRIDQVMDFAQLKEAKARMEAGAHIGKIVLRMPAGQP